MGPLEHPDGAGPARPAAPGWLARCHNVEDLRSRARRRLPRAIFDYLDGGAEDERTLGRNREAFDRYELAPRALVDVGKIDLETQVLGQRLAMPLVLAPCGLARLLHEHAEIAAARAAHRAGTVHVLSTMGSTSIEELSARSQGPLWYQLYVSRDRGRVEETLERARAAGYGALCLTVDTPVTGRRERDLRGRRDPPGLDAATVLDALAHPSWLRGLMGGPSLSLPNFLPGETGGVGKLGARAAASFDPTVSWSDLEWLIERWNGPFALKGVLRADDATRAVERGVQALIVSNHGGRQLDHAPASLDVLPEIVEAVGDRAEVLVDGGVRRGSDVVKALALGARACLIGRGYLYGLAAAGEAGVDRALALLRAELERVLALIGCRSARGLEASFLRRRG